VKLEPIIELPYMVTGLWRQFAVHLFEGKVTLADMDRIEAESAVCHAKVKGKLVELVVILPSTAQMTHDERVRMGRVIKRWETKRVASSTVILAEGLIASVHRSVLTGLKMLVPPPHPTKVFGTTFEAVRWLRPHIDEVCGEQTRADALLASIDTLRARFGARVERAPG